MYSVSHKAGGFSFIYLISIPRIGLSQISDKIKTLLKKIQNDVSRIVSRKEGMPGVVLFGSAIVSLVKRLKLKYSHVTNLG